jgi:hypothetical protein
MRWRNVFSGEELGGMCCGGSPADEFDEDESHNSFLNALAEWRGVEVEKIKEKGRFLFER